jgi:hypothetical protein
MHSIPSARKALAALTTIAALAALPGVASADDGKQIAVDNPSGLVRVPVDGGVPQPVFDDPGDLVRDPTKEIAELEPGLQRELDSIRARVGLRRTRQISISQEFRRLSELIEARNAGQPTNGIRAVTMGPGQLRVSESGATRLRMKCIGNAVEACSGIVWLTAEDGSLVTHKRFRVPAGEAKRLRLVIPAGKRRDGLKLTATATVHDASAAVWLVKRRFALAV